MLKNSDVPVAEFADARAMNKLYDVAPEIADHVFNAQEDLINFGLTQHKAKVCLVLDCSASMQNPNNFFSSGAVDILIQKALAIAYLFDDDKTIEVIPFGITAGPVQEISLENYKNSHEKILEAFGGMQGRTNYSSALKCLRQQYFFDNNIRDTPLKSELPVFVIWITDGECNLEVEEFKAQLRYASYEPIFFKFIALGGVQSQNTKNGIKRFMDEIDDGPVLGDGNNSIPDSQKRFVDNADCKYLEDPKELTMHQFFEEYPSWVLEVNSKNMLTRPPKIDQSKVRTEGRIKAVQSDVPIFDDRERITKKNSKSCCLLM